MDSTPGASCRIKVPESEEFQDVLLFGSRIWLKTKPEGRSLEIEGTDPGLIHDDGLLLTGSDGVYINVKRIKLNGNQIAYLFKYCFVTSLFLSPGKMKNAATIDQISKQVQIEYTEDEKNMLRSVKDSWEAILSVDVEDDTDFFACGAGSMDVVR